MSNTAALNIANIQVYAEQQAALDKAEGTFTTNYMSSNTYYLWQSNFQTIPMGMSGKPLQFVDRMIAALPGVNCVRIPFNIHSFNPDGSLHKDFEVFMEALAARGIKIIPVLADGAAQQLDGTSSSIANSLSGEVYERLHASWGKMATWMETHPNVKDAIYGWELLNEPAAYQRAIANASNDEKFEVQTQMVSLYVRHIAQLSAVVNSIGADAKVLVSAWGYGGDTKTLENVVIQGHSAIDLITERIGSSLVWSLHFYPGWMGTSNMTSPREIEGVWQKFVAPLGQADAIFTEINAPGSPTYDPFLAGQVATATALAMDWLKENGIGVGWFPALQTGSSGLALITQNGNIRYLNQPSLAAALNAFSQVEISNTEVEGKYLAPTLIRAALRNQTTDPDYLTNRLDNSNFAGIAFGTNGNDTIQGDTLANNFLYGGHGSDIILGSIADDFLFGQSGDDFIFSGGAFDHIFGGSGNDLLISNRQRDISYGGSGADIFLSLTDTATIIADFSSVEGDTWIKSPSANIVNLTHEDVNSDLKLDLNVALSDGSNITFLGMGGDFGILSVLDALNSMTEAELAFNAYPGAKSVQQVASQLLSFLDIDQTATTSEMSLIFSGTTSAEIAMGGDQADNIILFGGADTAFGNDGSDSLNGGSGKDLLFGGADNDSIHGGSGDDIMIGGKGNDLMPAGSGNDSVSGGQGNDRIGGAAGNDVLVGGEGNDQMYGGFGDDCLYGGLGSDILYGGGGADQFIFGEDQRDVSIDYVRDFNPIYDTILLRSTAFNGLANGTLAAGLIVSNTSGTATSALTRIVYETDTGQLFFDADGSGNGNAYCFAVLTPNLFLSEADMFVV